MKLVREHIILESYGSYGIMGAGYSYGGGVRGSYSRGGFGGAWNTGGPNTMYTYEIKPFNRTLEPRPANRKLQYNSIKIGSKISGNPIRSNANPDNKKRIKGIVKKIIITENGSLKYYIIQDEATQKEIKVEPLSAKLITNNFIDSNYNYRNINRINHR